MSKNNLTAKQEAFALEYILNGKDATAAYRKVYDTKTTNDSSLWVQAHNVRHNNKVALRIHQLEMQEYDSAIMTIEERKKVLTQWIKNGSDKALDLLNKMENVYVEKQEIKMEVSPLDWLQGKE